MRLSLQQQLSLYLKQRRQSATESAREQGQDIVEAPQNNDPPLSTMERIAKRADEMIQAEADRTSASMKPITRTASGGKTIAELMKTATLANFTIDS